MPPEQPDGSLPRLVPLTHEARDAVQGKEVALEQLPFRVGRDLRDPDRRSFRFFRERRREREAGPNELYIPEATRRHRLSREHFLIDHDEERYYLRDRNSACGTVVEGEPIGGERRGGRAWLKDGDVIIAGGVHSPYVFKFVCPNGAGPPDDS